MADQSRRQRNIVRIVALALCAAGVGSVLLLRGTPARAQGPMSVPACQCSVAVAIPGLGSRIAHCMCGVMACAITEPVNPAAGDASMQCVRQ